jgi:restriction endonuclease S subunit
MQSTIVLASQLQNTKSFRFDAEYYHPKAIEYEKKIVQKFHGQSIKDTGCKVVSGPFGSSLKSDAYLDSGVPFIRISDLRDFLISDDKLIYISEEDNNRLSSSKLKIGDIILSKVGNTIGVASIVTKNIGYCNISENNIGIRMPTGMNDQKKSFLVTYLNSIPGQNQILRAISGNAQPKLNVADIEEVKVPLASNELLQLAHNVFESSSHLIQTSESKHEEAKNILLSELGLINWQPKRQLTFIKNYSDTEKAERIDSEYYQPKYDELLQPIKNNSKYVKAISEMQTHNARGQQPKYSSDGTLDVITSKHILDDGLDFDNFEKTDFSNWDNQKKAQIKKGDILTYTTGANIGRTAFYPLETQALASNHVNILRIKDENPEYVGFVMNSLIGRMQTERMSAGSAQAELYPKDIDKFVIPFIAKKSQISILNKVSESRQLRKQSKHLLECAKRAVEMAIEEDEQSAISWLKKQTQELG